MGERDIQVATVHMERHSSPRLPWMVPENGRSDLHGRLLASLGKLTLNGNEISPRFREYPDVPVIYIYIYSIHMINYNYIYMHLLSFADR